MQTLTIEIINEKAIRLLEDLELLQLIRIRKDEQLLTENDWSSKYKGSMAKQPLPEIDSQLNKLRNDWQ